MQPSAPPDAPLSRAIESTRLAARVCRGLALLLVALFLASIARSYHPGTGFTSLISFAEGHEYELPALRVTPHYHHPGSMGYDGQFYAQLALVPLLQDPAIDRVLDNPQYRARRILFSWTAHLLGLGRPAWVLQAYALQNVACWLILAWLLTRWMPVSTPRGLATWIGCLFGQGLLWSVRGALLDGPSLLLLGLAAAAAENGRRWITASILGISGLARETNLLGVVMLPRPARAIDWIRTAGACALAALPLLLWHDYLWSIYRRATLSNDQNQLSVPLAGYFRKWEVTVNGLMAEGPGSAHLVSLLVIAGLTVQGVYVATRRDRGAPWWRLSIMYLVLMCLVHWVVWDGFPGAVTRVLLPLTVGFNVLLASQPPRAFWAWFALGNLQLVDAWRTLWW